MPLDDVVLVFDDTDAPTNRYLHGPGIDQVFADEDAVGDILWSLTDHQGTIRDWADYDATTDTTTVTNHLEYDTFGNITAQTNGSHTPLYAYTGREWDPDVGLQYNRGRWYDPPTGRWISEDPIGFNAGDANLVRYVGNGPVNTTDPSGLIGGYYAGYTPGRGYRNPHPSVNSNPVDFPTGSNVNLNLGTRIGGFLQLVGGFFQAGIGAALTSGGGTATVCSGGTASPVSIPVTILGTGLGLRSVDNFYTGWNTMWSGEYNRTILSQALDPITGDPNTSEVVTGVGEVVVTGGGVYVNSARMRCIPQTNIGLDPFVGTHSNAGFARLIGWGTGPQTASARTASITLQEIQQAGITRPVAEHWLNFYRNAVANGQGGATAPERVRLMQRVLELLGGG